MDGQLEAQLCVSCGLCCDGTIFTHAGISEKENVASSVSVYLQRQSDGRDVLPLGCSLLQDRCCTVYAERPTICRSYSCSLLKAARSGAVSLTEAHRLVAETSALRDRARAAVSDAVGKDDCNAINEMAESLSSAAADADDAKAFRRRHSEAYLAVAAVRMAVEEHFHRYPDSMWGSSKSEMG